MRGKLYIPFIISAVLSFGFLPAVSVKALPLDRNFDLTKATPVPDSRIAYKDGHNDDQKDGNANSIASARVIILRADSNVSDLHLEPPPPAQVGEAVATVSIDYIASGQMNQLGDTCTVFPDTAKPAFNAAANIWGTALNSTVPIVIEACWTSLPPGILGHSGALSYHRNFANAPVADTWYPASLANALAGSDQNPGFPDMSIAYSSNFASSFYYGTDGNVPANRYDFETIVLHEISHGLGFSGSMLVGGGVGSWGYGGSPDAYDRFTQDQAANALTNTTVYPNPSIALGGALTSGNVFFSGTHANAVNGGQRVKLHAPSTWVSGTSYSHLDDVFNGTANALMTYSLSLGESLHNPGPVTSGIFQDLGWPGTPPPPPLPTVTPSGPTTPVPTFSVVGRITDDLGSGVEGVFFSYGQGTVATSDADGYYTINGLTPGSYRIVPSKSGYVFAPAHIDVNILTTDLANQNFQGNYSPPPAYKISGHILGEDSQPVSGVTISLPAGISVSSDATGSYAFTNLAAGAYVLTPTKSGYTFMPASRNVSLTNGDVGAQDFIAHLVPLPTYTISGQIKDTNGFVLPGVTLTDGNGHSAHTDANGKYSLGELTAGTYDLMPMLSGYTFSPASFSVTIVAENVSGQDFTATALPNGPYSISGKVKDGNGTAIAGVLVTDVKGYSALSDGAGNYTIGGLPVGSYTLGAAKSGYQFTAAFSNPLDVLNTNLIDQNFIGSAAPAGSNTISGLISDASGAALPGVTVEDNQGFFRAVSDANGQYILKNLPPGTYLLRAVHGDEVFAPALRVLQVPPDATAQDFIRLEHKISVNSTQDEHDATPGDGQCLTPTGVCSLRAAIEEANAANDGEIIHLPGGTYVLSLTAGAAATGTGLDALVGSLPISATLAIQGDGTEKTIVDARGTAGVFEINQTSGEIFIEMKGLTIQGGSGAGILARSGDGILVLDESAVRDNRASGILTQGLDVILDESRVSGNKTYDLVGGMDVDLGMTVLVDSAVSGNEGIAGGVHATAGLLMTGSTVNDNHGIQMYGGVAADKGGAIVNSTISGNTGNEGGGLWASGEVKIYNATIVKNEALGSGGGYYNSGLGGGIYVFPGSSGVTLRNTLLVENKSTQDAPDCFGIVNSAGHTLIGDKTGCTYTSSTGDVLGYDPGIDGLDDNGGMTYTHAILPASWAIDAGDPAGCIDQNGLVQTHDQRGSPRPVDGKGNGLAICDIGSYEYQRLPSPYQITGQIVDDRFQPLSDATIFLNNGLQTISDAEGNFTFPSLSSGEYKITVVHKDYKFSPQGRQVSLPPDAKKQNFVGIHYDSGQYSISGRVGTAAGTGLAGVTITLETGASVVSDGRGDYLLEGVNAGIHTITPYLRGYQFTPLKLTVNLAGDLSGRDFIGAKK